MFDNSTHLFNFMIITEVATGKRSEIRLVCVGHIWRHRRDQDAEATDPTPNMASSLLTTLSQTPAALTPAAARARRTSFSSPRLSGRRALRVHSSIVIEEVPENEAPPTFLREDSSGRGPGSCANSTRA